MIEDPPLLSIRRTFERPGADQVAALTAVPTGYLVDCMDGYGALDYRIKPLEQDNATFTGVALTCHAGPADNLAVFGALYAARPGDVIVAATGDCDATCVIGDLVLGMAKNCDVVAFVTDGLVRDQDGLREVGLPTFSRGITPNSPANTGPGTVGLPVTLGGVTVTSGDILLADRDGVVVVPHAGIDAVIDRLQRVRDAEMALDAEVSDGLSVPPEIRELLAGGAVRSLD